MLTKTDYLSYKQCSKSFWLQKSNKHVGTPLKSNESRLDKGNQVTELARDLFPGGKLIPYLESQKMVRETKRLIDENITRIYEGTFAHDGVLVRCDLLVKDETGWDLYEVKSSTNMKSRYFDDLAIQAFVVEKSGLHLKSINIVYLNNEYVRLGDLDLSSLFSIRNVTEETRDLLSNVEMDILSMKKVIGMSNVTKEIGPHCEKYGKDGFPCEFINQCWADIPSYSVFDIPRINKKKFELYERGIVEIQDIPDDFPLSKPQQFQVKAYKENTKILDKESLTTFMSTFQYPLYFLDFETYQQAIPLFEGVKPYQQIPFQYSLHIIENKNMPLKHKEFLAIEGTDPRSDLAERIVEDPLDVCSISYNMAFEKMVLKGLAELYPHLGDHLINIHDNMVDLMIPFQKKWVYLNEMKGRYSIKYVLPALFPNDDELNYQNLVVQNGSMAMSLYETLHLQSREEIEKVRKDLLEYCKLDTLAMVRIWEKCKMIIKSY